MYCGGILVVGVFSAEGVPDCSELEGCHVGIAGFCGLAETDLRIKFVKLDCSGVAHIGEFGGAGDCII